MASQYHEDEVFQSRTIAAYLSKRLDETARTEFEDHYLSCDECFEALRGTELLISGLGRGVLEKTHRGDITVVRFVGTTQLISNSSELEELGRLLQGQGEKRVLVDLSRVSRIDSVGLGMLMNCYTHVVRNSGAFKLLNPNKQVEQVLTMTRINSVIATFNDESAALMSFQQ